VTGAGGYIGGSLCHVLARAGHDVCALFRSPAPESGVSPATFSASIHGDLRDPRVRERLVGLRCEAIVHAASAPQSSVEKDFDAAIQSNVAAAYSLLDRLSASTSGWFLNLSSVQVYGSKRKGSVSEDTTPEPETSYALLHVMREAVCGLFDRRGRWRCTNLRVANVYGTSGPATSSRDRSAIRQFCRAVRSDGVIRLKSDGSDQRDFIHIRDVERAVLAMLGRPGERPHDVVHVASGETQSVLDAAWRVALAWERLGKPRPRVLDANGVELVRPACFEERYRFDIQRLVDIGWQPNTTFEVGVEQTLRDVLSEPGDSASQPGWVAGAP